MGVAINAMHAEPGSDWTLQELAEQACMSRSSFAQKFKQTVGASPIKYLTRWRMLSVGDRLTNSTNSISVIALSLGYESESAFSTALKRVTGCSPRQYSREKSVTLARRRAIRPRHSARRSLTVVRHPLVSKPSLRKTELGPPATPLNSFVVYLVRTVPAVNASTPSRHSSLEK